MCKPTFEMQRSTGNKSVEHPENVYFSVFFFSLPVASLHLSEDLIHKHVMLDSG